MGKFDLFYANSPKPLEDGTALYSIGYGLYVVTTRENGKDSGLIVNTVSQVGSNPTVIAVGVNRANHSCGVISRTRKLNVNVLTENAPFDVFKRFGFQSGKDTDKMKDLVYGRSENNLPVLKDYTNAFLSLKVEDSVVLPSHTLFLCTIEESASTSRDKSMTYAYYHAAVKPKNNAPKAKGWVCKICGYVHPDNVLSPDFICPICKHPASDFEKL
jgi:flavin reductase (DIM6/NTAB) family NADH-FMN oxidoreductase RutF